MIKILIGLKNMYNVTIWIEITIDNSQKKTKWDLNKKYAFFCKSKHKIKKYSKETTEFRLKLYTVKSTCFGNIHFNI